MDDINEQVRTLFVDQRKTYDEIAAILGTTRSAIAGRCKRLGLKREKGAVRKRPSNPPAAKKRPYLRVVHSSSEIAERAMDERDLDMLSALNEGQRFADICRKWEVSSAYLSRLIRESAA